MIAGEWSARCADKWGAGRKKYGPKWGGKRYKGKPDPLAEALDELADLHNYLTFAAESKHVSRPQRDEMQRLVEGLAKRISYWRTKALEEIDRA